MIGPPDRETYSVFPYRKDYENGRTNNGGIDLTLEPNRIDEIHEFNGTPKLKQAILELNTENNLFMTLGFLIGKSEFENGAFFIGYLEFCIRPNSDSYSFKPELLDELFLSYISQEFGDTYVPAYQKIDWDLRTTSVHGSNPVPTYSVYFVPSEFETQVEVQLVPLIRFLQSVS
ncbi:hypothetical protein LVJ82_17085 [Vitreoscilla massiliensis]|uniref:Uncharacterized protein n=1 Tax=Vitreoscilla massiliensis TaxID=1689272 RepID=A0ABY4E1M4_9NEIS|nr:hypothetical protein [Vitreoscilla massiliensis]UOO89134.1 hypothetical protein LVJ82_17085 [Vitreoscilla massiliensis]